MTGNRYYSSNFIKEEMESLYETILVFIISDRNPGWTAHEKGRFTGSWNPRTG